MPPTAKEAEASKRRASSTLKKAKDKGDEYRRKYLAFRKETRETAIPTALMGAGGVAAGALTTGAVRGLMPDTIEWNKEKYRVGWVKDGLGIITGLGVGAAGALTGFPLVINFGGGIFAVCSAALVERGVGFAREIAWGTFNNYRETGEWKVPDLMAA